MKLRKVIYIKWSMVCMELRNRIKMIKIMIKIMFIKKNINNLKGWLENLRYF